MTTEHRREVYQAQNRGRWFRLLGRGWATDYIKLSPRQRRRIMKKYYAAMAKEAA